MGAIGRGSRAPVRARAYGRRGRAALRAIAAGLALVAVAACDDATAPQTGAMRVVISTVGEDLDDAYRLSVDDGPPREVGSNGEFVIAGLHPGDHSVQLGDIASNCSHHSTTREVDVARNDTSDVLYHIGCVPRVGTILVVVTTIGSDPDETGYTVSVTGHPSRQAGLQQSLTYLSVREGTYRVRLDDVAPNCSGGAELVVSVLYPLTTIVPFTVVCTPTTGAVNVAVTTTGPDPDDRYTVRVGSDSATVLSTGAAVLSRLSPGDRTISLLNVAPNCTVSGGPDRPVRIIAGQTVNVSYAVTCVATTGSVRVRVTTTGVRPDLDGYYVLMDDDYYGTSIASNGTVTVARILAGAHLVSLAGVAANCRVEAVHPRPVTVVAGATVEVVFSVACVEPGRIRIITSTSGSDLPGGYFITSPGFVGMIGPNATVLTGAELYPMEYEIFVQGIPQNCSLSGSNPRTVSVTSGAITDVTFAFHCLANGAIEVVTRTIGSDLDANGYVFRTPGFLSSIGVNATATLGPFAPGEYEVWLDDLAPNCVATSPNRQTVTVPSGASVRVSFDVTCIPATQLAFAADNVAAGSEIYTIRSNGGGQTRLTTNTAYDASPAWARDGRIAFTSDRSGNLDIWVMNANGTSPTRLTTTAAEDAQPSWSPDGTQIAFVSRRDGNDEIYVMRADGTNPVRLTNTPQAEGSPDWSPDGSRIAFVSTRDGNPEIYVMTATGANQTRLTNFADLDDQPAWSPDGTRIAFTRFAGCTYYTCTNAIFVMNADGSSPVRMSGSIDFNDNDPTWSPDGQWIAFTSQPCSYYGCGEPTITAARPSGADRTVIVAGQVYHPAWRW